MKRDSCTGCGQVLPVNNLFVVLGSLMCENCGNAELARHPPEGLPEDAVVPQVDPTVCGKCQFDGGTRELKRIIGVPVCDACEYELRHRPFPAWVKFSFAGLLALAVVCFAMNWRFFIGYVELHRGIRAFGNHDVPRAAAIMRSCAKHLPEEAEIKNLSNLFSGIELLGQDKSAEALTLLRQCAGRFPAPTGLGQTAQVALLQAEIGEAFETRDYERFLLKETELLNLQPTEPMCILGVASAHACKYAVSGQEAEKQEALRHIDRALQQSPAAEVQEYRQRILHRLNSREIIPKTEYDRRFPQGWKAEEQKP